MNSNEYEGLDAVGMAELVRKKEVKPSELTEEAIRQIERFNPVVNAVVFTDYDRARRIASEQDSQTAKGPFFGVPFLLKDILGDLEGWPSTIGSRMLTKRVMPKTCYYVERLEKAGLNFLGKSNAPEYGLLPTTENVLYGPARNPWNLEYSTGGSSGGAAAAVAAGMFPAAHGNDGGGSIRIPASSCGVIGFKPSRARNSLGPDFGHIIAGFVDEHVLTRTVRDSAAFLDATHGHIPGDPYMSWPVERPFLEEVGRDPGKLRIAYSKTRLTGEPVHPDCIAALEETIKVLESLGHTVEEAAPMIPAKEFLESFTAIWWSGIAFAVDLLGVERGQPFQEGELEALTQSIHAAGTAVTAPQFQFAELIAQSMGRELARFHMTYDCWLTSTMPEPTIRNGLVNVNESDLQKAYAPIPDYNTFCCIQNATGQPSVSLPLHWNEAGMPVGLMFSARNGEESVLFRLAAQLEQAKPWNNRRAQAHIEAAAVSRG